MLDLIVLVCQKPVCRGVCVLLALIVLVGCNTQVSQQAETPTGEATAGQPVPRPSSPLLPGTYDGDSASEVALAVAGQQATSSAKSTETLTVDAEGIPVELDGQGLTRGAKGERELGRSYVLKTTITSVRVTEDSVKVLYNAAMDIVLPQGPPVLLEEPNVLLSGKGQLTFEVSDDGETILVSDSADLTGIAVDANEPVSFHSEVTGSYSR